MRYTSWLLSCCSYNPVKNEINVDALSLLIPISRNVLLVLYSSLLCLILNFICHVLIIAV